MVKSSFRVWDSGAEKHLVQFFCEASWVVVVAAVAAGEGHGHRSEKLGKGGCSAAWQSAGGRFADADDDAGGSLAQGGNIRDIPADRFEAAGQKVVRILLDAAECLDHLGGRRRWLLVLRAACNSGAQHELLHGRAGSLAYVGVVDIVDECALPENIR